MDEGGKRLTCKQPNKVDDRLKVRLVNQIGVFLE